MTILGISAYYHDSAAALLTDGVIVAAAQEERFTRKKHDPQFPVNAIRYCLDSQGMSLDRLDAVVFYDKPLLKFERLLETYYGFAPRGLISFATSMPVWIKEKIFLKKNIYEGLAKVQTFNKKSLNLQFPEHHLSHAASAFYPSPFKKAAILTIDGVGEWATASICLGEEETITTLKEMHFPHSLGLLYSAFTYYLGFRVNSGEYKLMGLAPYGEPDSEEVKRLISIIKAELLDLNDDGSIWLNQKYFSYATGLRMVKEKSWARLFGFSRRGPEDEIEQHHSNLALAIQTITEEVVLNMAREAKRLTNAKYLCLAGGVALNCVANGKLKNEGVFSDIFIQPAAGDAGGALGAAMAAYHITFGRKREFHHMDGMQGAYLGPEFSATEIELTAKRFQARWVHYEDEEQLDAKLASLIANGEVVGWFQGRMEFGPRALGNRSILGDARNKDMQKRLNLKIKFRESFRPFAPSVLSEEVNQYFDLQGQSPYMLLVANVNKDRHCELPDDYFKLPIRERLYIGRSDIPAVTHMDFSARIQTVHRESNERYHRLLEAFKKQTGIAVLVNTSFNVRGEPIVCSPEDAYRCFMRTEMDILVMGNYLFHKEQQPSWDDLDQWKEEFILD